MSCSNEVKEPTACGDRSGTKTVGLWRERTAHDPLGKVDVAVNEGGV